MSQYRTHHVEIIPLETPRILNNCHRCKKTTEFYCSEKFRVNAQQKDIDVWLIYKCCHCDSTWNYPVVSRAHTAALEKDLHRRWMENDRETAWRYAFQLERLRKVCGGVNADIPYSLNREAIIIGEEEEWCISVISKYPMELRLDKLLKELLGVPRSRLAEMQQCGRIVTTPKLDITGKIKGDLLRILINPSPDTN